MKFWFEAASAFAEPSSECEIKYHTKEVSKAYSILIDVGNTENELLFYKHNAKLTGDKKHLITVVNRATYKRIDINSSKGYPDKHLKAFTSSDYFRKRDSCNRWPKNVGGYFSSCFYLPIIC